MKLIIHFDGSCGPKNPGGTAIGAWIIKGEHELARRSEVACSGEGATNNIAEWHGLLGALQYIKEYLPGAKELDIRGDSQLVVNQLNRTYQCKKPHLQKYRDECWEI